jgi:hypothetical protein
MASTGLLSGVNPYKGGNIAVDFTSKPVNLFIQLQQKEAAKREALDKYFMDYEKSLNPAGMRQQDQDVFLSKLAQAKQYYLQNRDKILNPAKYGAEFQSTYNAGLREAQSLIGQSKQAYGEDKAFKTYVDQLHKSGKALDENKVFDMLNRSKKAISMGYEAPDSTIIESWTPHNPLALLSKINTLKRTEGAAVPSFLEGSKVKYQDVSPLTIDQGQLRTLANGELQDTGYRKYIEYIASQPTEVERLNKISPLPDKNSPNFLSELSYANILSQAPVDEKRSNVKLTTEEQIRIARAKQKPSTALEDTQKTLGYIQGGLDLLAGNGEADAVNDYFKYWKSGGKGQLGGTVGFDKAEKISPGVYNFKYNISKDGVAIPQSTTINTNDPAAKNKLFALNQQFLGSNTKAEAALIPTGKPSSNSTKTYEYQGKKYTEKELSDAAAQSGMSLDEYKKALKLK